MISAGRSASGSHGDPRSNGSSSSSSSSSKGREGKPFDAQGRRPPPSGAGPDDEAPQLVEEDSAATRGCPRLNEMLLVYLALLYASFIGPANVLSLAYFACALAATPICTYAPWVSPRARRGLCVGLACLSAGFLILQGSMVAVARVGGHVGPRGAQALVKLLAIEESGPVSFRLLSFITRDVAVLIAAVGALQLLRRTEDGPAWRRLALASPVRILPKASFLDCNWRMLTLGVLIVSSLVYPSLLSLPFYLAYLATLTAWTFDAFPLSSPAASERRLNSNRLVVTSTGTGGLSSRNMRPLGAFGRGWERALAAAGAVYTGLYLLLIYLLQIPALAKHLDARVVRDYGAMSTVVATDADAHASSVFEADRHLAVFSFHTIGVALLYCVAAAAVTSASLERRRQRQLQSPPVASRGRRRTSAGVVASSAPAGGSGSGSPLPAGLGLVGGSMQTTMAALVEESESDVDSDGEGEEDGADGEGEEEHHPFHQVLKEFAQWFVARYGLYLCFLVYIILALERPTVLGFVFMLFVMVGAVLPGLVFRSCAPLLLVYTGCYAAAVYWFGAVGLRNGYFPPDIERRLAAIGLVPMDPFTDGWLIAGVPLFMTTLLGFTWHYRKTDQQPAGADATVSPPGAVAQLPAAVLALAAAERQDDVVTKILGPVEWLTYLENYLVAHDIGLYLCLNIAFAVGVSFLDLPHFPFIALASLIIVVPKAAPYLWGLAVGYAQCFILYLYWEHYKHDAPTSFGQAMALPVVFFVFGCRQFAVYLSSWRRGKGCWCCAGSSSSRNRHRHAATHHHHHHHRHGHRHGHHHRHHHHRHHHHHGADGNGDSDGSDSDALALRRRSSLLALQEPRGAHPLPRAASMRPTSRRVRATQAVNVSLYLAKIVLRLGLLGVMWHMAFHAPLTIFSMGYLALLAAVPAAFTLARSFHHTSRHHFPKLFRCMSAYAGLVLCTLHVFCSQDVRGLVIEEYVGVGLQEHATTLIVLNWVIQLLAASQTDLLRQQTVSLKDQLKAYPLFVHALKQVLPFTLLAAIFGIAWEHLSLFGAAILYLGILNTALGRKVGAMWRLLVFLAVALALAIMAFDLQPFQRHAASATLYWVGLRRGNYVPDPDAPRNSPPPPEAQGWLLSPSAEAYLIVAFLAALQFFYNGGASTEEEQLPQPPPQGQGGLAVAPAVVDGAATAERQPSEAQQQHAAAFTLRPVGRSKTVTFRFQETGALGEDGEEDGGVPRPAGPEGGAVPGGPGPDGAVPAAAATGGGDRAAATARLHAESSVSSVSEPPSPGVIDNTRALAPGVTTLIEMLYKGKITGAGEDDADEGGRAGGVLGEDDDGPPPAGPQQLALLHDGTRQLQSPDPLDPLAEEEDGGGDDGEGEGPQSNPLALRSPSPPEDQRPRPGSPSQPASASAGHHTRRGSVGGSGSPSKPLRLFGGLYHLLHRAVLTLLAGGAAFAFELCVVLTVIAALAHADLVSFLYLGLFGLLVALPRATLRAHWRAVIHGLALLVLAEYMFILRLPPAISYESHAAAQLLGARQCSVFAQYTPAAAREGPYSYGQWFGLCITEDGLVLLDFLVLVLAIVQHKRFKADKLRVTKPLFAPLLFERPNPLRRPEPDPSLDLPRYLVLQYGAYLTVIVIVILSTLTFNLLSLGYLLLIALMVQTHAQEGLLTARRFMWTPIAAYAWLCLVLRLLFQLPSWPTGDSATGAAPVLLGLRKVHTTAAGSPDYPPEMLFDGVILILIVLQRRVFLSRDFQRVVDELWYAEQYDYLAHGSHVVNQLEKIREDALAAIRMQIRTMYEQLETVARARMEEADNKSWEHFLLKNRGNAARDSSSGNSPVGGGSSPTAAEAGAAVAASGSMPQQREGLGAADEESGMVGGTGESQDERSPLLSQLLRQSPASAAQQQQGSVAGGSGQGERDPLLLQHQQSSAGSVDPSAQRRRRVSSIGAAALSEEGQRQQGEFVSGRTGMISFSLTHTSRALGDEGAAGGGLRMTASYDDRTQTLRRPGTGESTATAASSSSLLGATGGGGSVVGTPSTTRSGRARSMANEASALTQWVSDALKQSSLLEMKDPLNITDADVAAAAREHRPTTPVIESATRRMTLFTPVFGSSELDAGEAPLAYRDDSVERPLSTTSSSSLALAVTRKHGSASNALGSGGGSGSGAADTTAAATAEGPGVAADGDATAPPAEDGAEGPAAAAPASATARHGTKVGRFEQLVSQSFEEAKKRSAAPAPAAVGKAGGVGAWAARGRRAGWRVARNVVKFMNSRSTSMVYTVLVIAHMYEPSLLNAIYPISVFGYALLQNPRSLPRIGGSLIHPMIQNPPRHFWHFLLGYSFLMLVIKFIYQFPFFCTCANRYSSGAQCPSSLTAYKDVCEARPYPHLDYYIDQPIVTDYFIGVFKAFHALSWNEMSVRYEPVDRYLPPDPPGQASETTLDSGLGGAFLVSFLGDFLVLLAVLWHTHVLKTRGVWLSRDPDFLSAAAAGGGAASIAATDASASGLTPLNTHAVGGVGNNSSSHPAAADVAAPGASPGTAKKPKKGKSSSKARRPLSWSPSLYRKRLASPPADAMEAATGAATPPALASGTVGSGGGGGPTTTAAGAEEDAASEQERPSSIRSTASAELVRGESIITTTSSTGSAASAAEKPPSCLTRAFAPFFDSARAKPGSDLYVSLFFIQCLLFLFVLFAYQQADHLVQSVRENQLSGGFILVLLLHFILIVADRIIYLHRSIRWKLFLQWMLLLVIFGLIHSNFTFRIGINQHGPVFAWYCIMCAYLFVSGLQISYGYPPFIQTNWMTKRAHHFWGNIFRLYRSLPFLYELRMLLDWACTPTTLYLGEWIKLEDIYCGLFIQECNLHFQQVENRRKGDRQPVRRKVLCGFLFFALLNLLVWLPLFIFSTGSLSQFDNYVSAGSLSVQLNGFPKLYEAASADYISPILPTDTWSVLAQTNPALALLPATSTNDYMRELQFVRLPRSSQELWRISPPAEAELLGVLEGRAKQTPQAQAAGLAGDGADGEPAAPAGPVEAASVAATAVEMMLRFSFGTQDGSVNDGAVVHALSAEEKRQMAEIIRGNRTALRLQGVLPSIIRISTTKEVTPLLTSGDILGDCVLTFTKLGDEVSTNTTTSADATPAGADGEGSFTPLTTTAVGWWDFTCGSAARGCSTALEPQGPAAAVVEEDPVTGQPEPGCNPSIYTISSEKTIGSFFSLSYGIIGLYFTVVLAIGRFVHMSVMNKKYNIICDDLPRVEVLKELCETIYLARMYKNLALEEELYRELIDVYRRPQLLYMRTGPYRHWLREGDDGGAGEKSYYDEQVEKELKRYR